MWSLLKNSFLVAHFHTISSPIHCGVSYFLDGASAGLDPLATRLITRKMSFPMTNDHRFCDTADTLEDRESPVRRPLSQATLPTNESTFGRSTTSENCATDFAAAFDSK